MSPIDKYFALINDTLLWEDVIENYSCSTEIFREQDYLLDQRLVELKCCLRITQIMF